MLTKNTLLLLLLLSFFACKNREVLPMNGIINIAPAFQPYVEEFIQAAAERGVDIDFSDTGLSMQFSAQPLGIAARCMEFGDDRRGSHMIEFDENLWNIAAPERKAFLVFHELGHCELNRGHENEQLPNGAWQTMMQGTIADSPLNNKNSRRPVVFYGFRKDYYLDELFNPSTHVPDWSRFTDNYDAISDNQKMTIIDTLNINRLQTSTELINTNYELEVSLERLNNTGDIGIKYGSLEQSYIFKINNDNEILIELAGKVPTEIEFYNGGNVILAFPFRLFFCDDLLLNNSVNKLTIRQQNGIASFFLNEQFLYHVDAFSSTNILIGSIQTANNLAISSFSLATF